MAVVEFRLYAAWYSSLLVEIKHVERSYIVHPHVTCFKLNKIDWYGC